MRTTKSKPSEVGPIPEDWEAKRLGELFVISAAGDLQTECSSRERMDLNVYPIYSNSLENAGLYGYTSNPRYKADAVTITGRGTLGHAEYRSCDFDAIIRLIVLKPSGEIDGRYVVAQINHKKPFHFEITSIPQLTVPQVADSVIPVPPLPEQQAIAEALSDMDALLAAMTTLIEKKRAIKQGTMQQLLSGKQRLAGFTGKWVEKRLGDCGVWRKGQPLAKDELVSDGRIECIHYGELFTTYAEVIQYVVSRTNAKTAVVSTLGDILFPVSDVTPTGLGRCSAIMRQGVILGGDLIALSLNNDLCPEFISYAINHYKEAIVERVTGTAVKHISSKCLSEIVFLVPPTLAEQQAIAAVLSDMDAEIAALEAKREKYERIKQGMMQGLLTGKIRLSI